MDKEKLSGVTSVGVLGDNASKEHPQGLEPWAVSWVNTQLPIAMVLSRVCCFCPAEFAHCWGTVTAVYPLFVLPPEFLIAISLFPPLPFYIWFNWSNNLSFSFVAATSEPNREESTQRF